MTTTTEKNKTVGFLVANRTTAPEKRNGWYSLDDLLVYCSNGGQAGNKRVRAEVASGVDSGAIETRHNSKLNRVYYRAV